MKSTLSISRIRTFFALSFALLLLAGSGTTSVLAQNASVAMSPAAVSADVSQYPTNEALLPGKGPLVTWNGFPKVWADRHKEWARTAEKDKGAVVFLGDSITQGWHSLANAFPNIHVANRGIGGDTTRGVLYRLKADVLDLNPKAIVLLIGTNDIGYGATPEEVADNIEAILQNIKKFNPNMPVVVCKVMPRSDQKQRFVDGIEKLDALVAAEIKNDPQFTLCDTWSIYADENGGCKKEYFNTDLLHLNATGYTQWTAALKPVLAKLNLGTEKD
jgi:lysophospholipase L1-like esterase